MKVKPSVGRSLLTAAALLLAPGTRADDSPLVLLHDGDNQLKATVQVDTALFNERNAWFGEDRRNAGDNVHSWAEFGAMPGLEGQFSLTDLGTLYGRVSGVYTTTQWGLDAAGSNFNDRHPYDFTLEDGYVGWKSGDLFPSLGKDAIDLSVGPQKYQVGSGFLFWDGGTDGGSTRGGYWLGMRKAFKMTAIARLKTGPFTGEAVYLEPNDLPNTSTNIEGVNLGWAFSDKDSIGAGFWRFSDSEKFLRDGLDVYDLRGTVHPLQESLPGLFLSGEIVREKNRQRNSSLGGYSEIGYSFDDAPYKPLVSYRYASFTGDRNGTNSVEAFDPIFYGFNDWATWYIGEILGGFVGTNRDLETHTVRLRASPHEAWTVNLIWASFRLNQRATELQPRLFDPRVVDITDRNLGNEVDLIADWKMCDHLSWSAVWGTLFPSRGLTQGSGGGDNVWMHFMLYASIAF